MLMTLKWVLRLVWGLRILPSRPSVEIDLTFIDNTHDDPAESSPCSAQR